MIREGPLMRGLAWVQSAVAGVGGGAGFRPEDRTNNHRNPGMFTSKCLCFHMWNQLGVS